MAIGTLAPVPRQQFLDANGDPLAGALLYTYESGTATPSPIYTDAGLLVPFPNPAVADGAGMLTIYMPALAQKWVLTSAAGVTQWTVDPVASVGLAGSGGDLFEVFDFGGDSTSPITNTTYPTGATIDQTHAGTATWVVTTPTMPAGTYSIRAMILAPGGDLVSVAIMNLSDGNPDTPLAVATGTSPTGDVGFSGPITFGAGGGVRTFGIKVQTAGGTGFVWGVKLVKT